MTNNVHSFDDTRARGESLTRDSHSPLIEDLMPVWSLREVDRIAVAAEPSRAFVRARGFDLGRFALVHALFALRGLPARVRGRRPPTFAALLEQIVRPGSGFVMLGEVPQREVVVGSIGTFWTPTIHFAETTGASFTRFAAPGYGKLAWSLRTEPRSRGSWLVFELRVDATDRQAWDHFLRYWRFVGPLSRFIRTTVLRDLERDLGSFGEREHVDSRRRGLGSDGAH